ncbi:trehalase family glycosidase [Paenibacillus yanchengensis]|uniref:Trehalase family glycosidase n=1 Tax=Paenibacillus yanchengensis TaxID=2035833 RepID=A0ABW4YGY6_9BACL
MIDEQLKANRKVLRALPDGLLLGSTGARLWADYLDAVAGFSGRFDFIHKVNLPLLFSIQVNGETKVMDTADVTWYPSHLSMNYSNDYYALEETKFITYDDCAISNQTWRNTSKQPIHLTMRVPDHFEHIADNSIQGQYEIPFFSYKMNAHIISSEMELLRNGIIIQPGQQVSFIVGATLGINGQDDHSLLRERLQNIITANADVKSVLQQQQRQYQQWFDRAPKFHSSDKLLNKTWLYRWFILRYNLADPKYGLLQHPLFYEGRSHKKSKKPFSKGGWEFSKLINLSAPLHLTDARWHHDATPSIGSLKNMVDTPMEDGMFCCLTVDYSMHSFANYMCWAVYQLYLVHREKEPFVEALPALKKQLSSWHQVYGNEVDFLMTEFKHTRTGKEYQPSYWYFHDYPKNPKDQETYTPVKRVDRTVYHYLNALGVANLCKELQDPEAEYYENLAKEIKASILDKMWDEETSFFYDLHYETDEKALVKNIVGFYPAWAEILDQQHNELMAHLVNPEEFSTAGVYPTVSIDSKVFAREGGWFGKFIKGRNGCMWNGPSWPYTTGIALDALARESKRQHLKYNEAFAEGLRAYSFQHFQNHDLNQPGLVEHYNGETGEPLSDEQEYNHSYYIDLIVTHVAGLQLTATHLSLQPIDVGLDYFVLDDVMIAGNKLRITYLKSGLDSNDSNIQPGYHLYSNNKLIFSAESLQSVEIPLVTIN